jgi:hypothetical protein
MTATSQRTGGSGRERRLWWCAGVGMAMLVALTIGTRAQPEGALPVAPASVVTVRAPGVP